MARNNREQKFTKRMQLRLVWLFVFVLLLLGGLNLYIASINVEKGEQYAKQVLSQQTYDSRIIPYRRGEIMDRNGNLLAKSEKMYNVVLDCFAINSMDAYVEPTIRAVSELFGLDSAEVRECVSGVDTSSSRYQVVKKEITADEKQAFLDYIDIPEDTVLSETQIEERSNVKGVWFEETYVRNYPLGSVACSVIGFSNKLNDGIAGLESYYSEILNGVNGREYGYLNEDFELQENIIAPKNGNSLVTTIDVNIQQVCERYIAQLEQQNKYGPYEETAGRASKNTAVIVADPNTGEILAMATDRVYDPNDPQDLSVRYTSKQLKKMTEDDKAAALTELWYNFCVSEAFELGSTYKPNVVAAALDSGKINTNFGVTCIGYLQPVTEEEPINCTWTHGKEGLGDVIKNSCNPGMMTIALQMGIETFCKYQSIEGFGKRTGIDLPNENSGSLYNANNMGIMELCTYSFGQGFTATMIQELMAFCADVNGGYYYKPHMVRQILDADGKIVKNIEPLVLAQPVSTKTSYLLREYLESVVTDGTATDAKIPGYRIGGKTGTAEKLPRGNNKYIISYIAAAPIDDPKVVVYTVIDEPNIGNQEDGSYTKNLAKNILTEILPYMGIYPTEEITTEQREALGMQIVKKRKPNTIIEYVYDDWGNLMYDEETWEPLTEVIEVDEDGKPIETENTENLSGNVAPPEQFEEAGADENYYGDSVTAEDLGIVEFW